MDDVAAKLDELYEMLERDIPQITEYLEKIASALEDVSRRM